MKSSFFEGLKVISWLLLTAILVTLPLIPSAFGVSDELIRSTFSVIVALAIAVLLLIQFAPRGKVSLIHSPISILIFFLSLIVIFSSYFSLSISQSLFGFGMEIGTATSFAVLFLFYYASRKLFSNPNLIERFYKALSVSFIILVSAFLITETLDITGLVFNISDLIVFSGLILLIATATFEFSKHSFYTILLIALSYFGLLISSDKTLLIPIIIGILIIIFSKFFLVKKTSDGTSAPYVSGIVLISICALFVFNVQPVINFDQQGEIRPSWEATRIVASKAIVDNPVRAILGTGPNTFPYVWNSYKPEVINNSHVWNVDFQSGIGEIPTLFVTIGLLGGLSLILLIGTVFYIGVIGLVRNYLDRKRFFLVCTSFVGSIYGLSMLVLQTQSVSYIALTFAFLGILSVTAETGKKHRIILLPKIIKTVLVMFIALLLTVAIFFVSIKAFQAISFERNVNSFNKTKNLEVALENIKCLNNYIDHPICYRFLSELHRSNLQTMFLENGGIELNNGEISKLLSSMLTNAQKAVEANRVDYRNWVALGNAYTQLALMGANDGLNSGIESYDKAIELSPTNPFLLLLKAQLIYYIGNDTIGAKQLTQKSLDLKPDYEPSIKFLEEVKN